MGKDARGESKHSLRKRNPAGEVIIVLPDCNEGQKNATNYSLGGNAWLESCASGKDSKNVTDYWNPAKDSTKQSNGTKATSSHPELDLFRFDDVIQE